MTRRLLLALRGERDDLVIRSRTGTENDAVAEAWTSHYADRGLLLLTIGWLGLRIDNWMRLELRPEAVYEAQMWLGKLVFPSLPNSQVWFVLVTIAFGGVLLCLARPRWIAPRVVLATSLLLVIAPEFGFGHMQHVDHLFLMAHVYSIFRPLGRPHNAGEAIHRAEGYAWFLLGLLAIYTASGLWKVVDMTVRDFIKPGVTWLEPEALLATSVASMRTFDLPMTIPRMIEAVAWVFPIGYVIITAIFSASFLAAFRRPLIVIVLPLIIVFHILNAVALYALFVSTIFVAIVVFVPYELFVPAIQNRLVPIASSSLEGTGLNASYKRLYENGDRDTFLGFYAYREALRDKSVVLAALLYYPGAAWIATHVLERRQRRANTRA